ncbi:hypothetical protein FMEAI12_3340017 [Parafrankia sp. Ea1.12]|nr:hypothetical protein FMEAI12_3340017 [Parafrankia sp. Ea1.12]
MLLPVRHLTFTSITCLTITRSYGWIYSGSSGSAVPGCIAGFAGRDFF